MIGHRTYLDARQSAFTRSVRQPVARGHRKWLSVASRIDARSGGTEGSDPKGESLTAESGDAQGGSHNG